MTHHLLKSFPGVIDAILETDGQVPGKQRHTAKRIFERSGTSTGSKGQYTIVKDYGLGENCETLWSV